MEGKIVSILLTITTLIILVFLTIQNFSNDDYIDNVVINNKHKNNEVIIDNEYIYKEKLISLGYSNDEIDIIKTKISNDNVNDYLLEKKYDNLINFISSPYFNIKNIDRYQKYYNDNSSYSYDDVVIYVEIGLDNDFYTNVKKTNLEDGNLILVNKYNNLSNDYTPKLVKIASKYGSGSLTSDTYNSFKKMCDEALKDNIKLNSVSAYRSYSTQKGLYNRYVERDGVKKADTYSARPGYSEHQTGLAIDINTASSSAHFENTKEYDWLINNSYKYGFILRYPKDKVFITGYKYEPWHYRYVGIDVATKIFEEKITYEEYYVKYLNSSNK